MSYARVERTFSTEPPSRFPFARRVLCKCGCGRWFYWTRKNHRPPEYASPYCYNRARNARFRRRR